MGIGERLKKEFGDKKGQFLLFLQKFHGKGLAVSFLYNWIKLVYN